MSNEALKEAVEQAKRVGQVLVASADEKGRPHIATAGKIALTPDDKIMIEEWFCPTTAANVNSNPLVSIVVRDEKADTSYQILGTVEEVKDVGALDGYVPEVEAKEHVPQTERQLFLKVDKVVSFSKGPHSDTEE